MKDNLKLIIGLGVLTLALMGIHILSYNAGRDMGYAAGHYAGRKSAPCPIETAPVKVYETPWNWYYLRGSTVTDESGTLGYGITFPDTNEARRFIAVLQELQENYLPQE